MHLDQLLAALEKRGIGEALMRGGEPMQVRIEGQWKAQGAPIAAANLSAILENSAPAEALTQWQNQNQCQFEHQNFLVKAARNAERVQIALKRKTASTDTFAPATAPATAPLKPAIVEWFYIDEGAEKGPLAPDRVRMLISMGTIGGDTLVWRDGMTDWLAARDSDLRGSLPASALNPAPVVATPVAPIAAPRGDIKPGRVGGGRIHEIPPSHDKFSLGAFALPLFWCASHNQTSRFWPILLTGFIPCVGGLVSLYLTIQLAGEANSLAWASRQWDSVEHFEKTQRVWTIVGGVMLVLSIFVGVAAVLLDKS